MSINLDTSKLSSEEIEHWLEELNKAKKRREIEVYIKDLLQKATELDGEIVNTKERIRELEEDLDSAICERVYILDCIEHFKEAKETI